MTNSMNVAPSGGAWDVGPLLGPVCLTVNAPVASRFVGEVEGGYRVDLELREAQGAVHVAGRASDPGAARTALDCLDGATILSGADWVFVSKTGVATFDTRLTLWLGAGTRAAGEPAPHVVGVARQPVVSVRLRGRADLRRCRDERGVALLSPTSSDADVLAAWNAGLGAGAFVPLGLAMFFEIPLGVVHTKARRAPDATYDVCRELDRHLFVAAGRATFGAGAHSPILTLQVRAYPLGVEGDGSGEGAGPPHGKSAKGAR